MIFIDIATLNRLEMVATQIHFKQTKVLTLKMHYRNHFRKTISPLCSEVILHLCHIISSP